jgi:hypothetical protein
MRVSVRDYSAPVPLYKFGMPRIYTGLPRAMDNLRWTMDILTNPNIESELRRKYPEWNGTHAIKAAPHPFARLLAKIAYGYVVAEWGVNCFDPLVLDIILGRSDDYFYSVGGTWEIPPPIPGGNHITNINVEKLGSKKLRINVDIRLFSNIAMPAYVVVVGHIDLQNPQHLAAFTKHRADGKIPDNPF